MKKITALITVLALLLLSGCNTVISDNTGKGDNDNDGPATAYDLSFREADIDSEYAISGSTYISLGDEDVKITKGGTYILEGQMNGASVIVDVADNDDVRLVLNNVTINAEDFAGIYIINGDEITITLAEGSNNTITDSGDYEQIDDNSVDALIYSKADLIINGNGTLNLKSSYNHGIVSKDDLIITGGTYNIETAGQGLRGKDCLKIRDGTFNLVTYKDALKSDNSSDEYRGYVYITGGDFVIETYADAIYGYSLVNITGGDFVISCAKSNSADSYKAIKSAGMIDISNGTFKIDTVDDAIHCDSDVLIGGGTFEIESGDDAIHADQKVEISDGKLDITAAEGIEATYVLISGGDITINASDDGINAGAKSSAYTPTVEITGGKLTINMGQGDTDGIDSNGYIYIKGGTVAITAQFPFDYDSGAELSGGTVTVNGEEVDEISNQFGGGGPGGGFPGGDNGNNDNGFPGGSEPPEGQSPGEGQMPPGQSSGGGDHHH
ncbi:MAG: carbohydrate-binding domain-containing protein [Erysipelotrichaceae bacterium]|nr:carbohydrate-binding domain-containing protein [Erysipelotrichaceae bacterium]